MRKRAKFEIPSEDAIVRRLFPRRLLRDGEPCESRTCLNHVTKPCDNCGRIAGRARPAQEKPEL